jgi:hypothetical protein
MKDLTILSASQIRIAEKQLMRFPSKIECIYCKKPPRKKKFETGNNYYDFLG